MAQLSKNMGRGKDLPQLEAASFASLAAGTATDPAQDTILAALPDLKLSFLPSLLGTGLSGNMPINRMAVRQAMLISQGSANTVGNATNNCELRMNLWRKGVLQGMLAYYPLTVNTTIGTAVTAGQAGSVQTVTPASMTGIKAGMALGVGSGGTFEVVYPYNITATTFTAYWAFAHANSDAVTSILVPFQPIAMIPAVGVNTTSSTTITSGSNKTVTPNDMHGIHVGDQLFFTGGTGTAETVTVKTVTNTTFTADFANGHSGGYTISLASPANIPVEIQAGDVITINRLSNNVTGLATPTMLVEVEWVASKVLA